jgi:hypothetical protein
MPPSLSVIIDRDLVQSRSPLIETDQWPEAGAFDDGGPLSGIIRRRLQKAIVVFCSLDCGAEVLKKIPKLMGSAFGVLFEL